MADDLSELNDLISRLVEPFDLWRHGEAGSTTSARAKAEYFAILQEFWDLHSVPEIERPKIELEIVRRIKKRIAEGG